MDDKDFDDIIKRKVGEHEDPVFDSSALSSFHQQMATLDYMPWTSRYRTELMIGSGIAISTLPDHIKCMAAKYRRIRILQKK